MGLLTYVAGNQLQSAPPSHVLESSGNLAAAHLTRQAANEGPAWLPTPEIAAWPDRNRWHQPADRWKVAGSLPLQTAKAICQLAV